MMRNLLKIIFIPRILLTKNLKTV
ncbi:MAG: hypothetical protein JWR54_2430, partial [Mucilaginibacter sp.]|nr:hypothetical protein [Mucilaginibacter sp.]